VGRIIHQQNPKLMKQAIQLFVFLLLITGTALANKTSVTIEAPKEAQKGQEITITLHVKHNGNNFLHHTDWVKLKVNGELIKEWDYKKDRPDSENFDLTYKIKVEKDLNLEAEGHCNNHGTKNTAQHTIKLTDKL